jgi:hypothetical protein
MEPLFSFTGGTILSGAALLTTAALLGEMGIALVILLRRGNWLAARWVATSGAAIAGTYMAVLAGVSLTSGGHAVERGGAEHVREEAASAPRTTPSPALPPAESSPVVRLLIGHERALFRRPGSNSLAGSQP